MPYTMIHVQRKTSPEEKVAFQAIVDARRENFNHMFKGTRLAMGELRIKEAAQAMNEVVKGFKNCAGKQASVPAAPPASVQAGGQAAGESGAVMDFIRSCTGAVHLDEIAKIAGDSFIHDLVKEITPFAGIVASGGKLAKAVAEVAQDCRHLYKFEHYKSAFLPGDATAAADAVQHIIKVNAGRHSVDIAQHSVAFAAKITGALGDGGALSTPAVGLTSALVSMARDLTVLAMEIQEMNAGNARLSTPETLDITVFKECPILGCYLLACSNTSDVANLCLSDIGDEHWMDKLEALKKSNMEPLLGVAKKAIEESRVQLGGLESDKGMHSDPGFVAKKKAQLLQMAKQKDGSAAVADISSGASCGSWFTDAPDFMTAEEAVDKEALASQ